MNRVFVAMLLLAPAAIRAQAPAHSVDPSRPVLRAARTSGAMRIDGRLDEPSWAQAQPVSTFTQVDPDEGKPASEPTEVRILYDEQALYVGVRLRDSQKPSQRLGRRDMDLMDSDWLGVVIDSYHDHRTGFSMDINPAGVQRDAAKSMGSGGVELDDLSWDAVWEAKATVDDGGWTAEYRIPFSQLRFGRAPEQTWGIQVERIIGRRREYSVLSFTPKSEAGGIPTFAHLVGLRNVNPGHRLEVLPYAVGRSEHVDPGPNPFRTNAENSASAGVDLLYRITSDFAVNASINPDFGQVEVDPAVVNLSVYETFFEEKRPFFIEGSEIFDFGRNTSGGRLFYTRRIGRSPQLAPPTAESDVPEVATILGAAKLSGKTASGWSLGIIEAVTDRENARYLTATGAADRYAVEPRSNYFVARTRKDANQGRMSFGGILTAVNRDLATRPMRDALRSSAYAGGLDFRSESADRAWLLLGSAAFSRVAGSPEAMMRVQTAGNHFFQRPDATHLGVNTKATSLSGYSIGASVTRQGGTHWRGNLALAATSPAFEVNDLGYQNRTDRRDIAGGLTYMENKPGSFLRNYSVTGTLRAEHNYDWQRILGLSSLQFNFRTLEFWTGAFGLTHSYSANDDRSTRGGPILERPAQTTAFVRVASDGRKPISVIAGGDVGWGDYGFWMADATVGVVVRPSERWSLQIDPEYSRMRSPAQYVRTVANASATRTYGAYYLFAPLVQTSLVIETRLDVTFTPKLSFQLYAQPFLSSGDYGDVGSLDAPRGFTFTRWTGGTGNNDFNYRSLRGTGVLRWEYRPGSTLYLAWQQARSDYASGVGDFDFSRDRQALFRAKPDNVLVLKASYWLSP